MAYIQQDDKLMGGEQPPNTDYPQAQAPTTGGASADVGSGGGGVSTAGVGAGGTGQWTNVQSYLDANKSGTGSAQALQNQVGSQFNQEKTALGQNAQTFLGDAQKQVDDSKIDDKKADELIGQAAGSYQWDGSGNNDYNQTVDKVQGALTNQYSGPTSYSYGFSAPTQKYGQGLKDNGAFDSVMGDVYSKSAGKDLTRGQFDLQKQLDVNNEGLSSARQRLLEQYSGLEGERDKTVADTTGKLGGLADQYRQNQTSLADYLSGAANKFSTQQAQAEQGARQSYDTEYSSGQADAGSWGNGNLNDAIRSGLLGNWGPAISSTATHRNVDSFVNMGDNGKAGVNWQDMQNMLNGSTSINENNFYDMLAREGVDSSNYGFESGEVMPYTRGIEQNYRDQANNSLQNFYSTSDQKYAGTADNEKRSYNSILDFLNQTGGRAQQGFKVRG
jgi:hypothetical protein